MSQSIYREDPDGRMVEPFVDGDSALWAEDPSISATIGPLAVD